MNFFSGRERIGITGIQNGKKVTIDLNVTTAFNQDYPVTVTQHPIEKDPENPDTGNISDHVIPTSPSMTMVAIIKEDVNLTSITTKSEKLKTLLYWQRTGSIVKFEGYGTGGLIGKMLSFFGMSGLFNDDLEEPLYMGLDDDVIENIAIGNIRTRRDVELGKSVELTLDLNRIIVTEAKTVQGSKKITVKGKTPTTETGVSSSPKIKSAAKAGT
ncbi:phage baseplate protein [Leptospira interrogans]|uniref:phage baseplate protein n=1 Tax=Leptospira interrogans TaxID=173 RepID=UPI001F0DA2B7|nr:hypothetical protein [Leptospira interrogans]UMQ59869.1 hypothetical protein FH585_09140 [Leptospira interrogans]UNE68792.1 hypothetical protein FH588_11500 [Leptospira interrogans]